MALNKKRDTLPKSKPSVEARRYIALKAVADGETLTDAGIKGGFLPTTARNSTKLKKSITWPELLEKIFPDDHLMRVHQEGLRSTQFIAQGVGRGETILHEKPDYNARFKYLSKLYDLKGKIKQADVPLNAGGNTMIIITTPQAVQVETPKTIDHVDIQHGK